MGEQVGQEVLARVDLLIRQGSDVTFALTYSESDGTATIVQDFAGWSARSQIRKKVGGEVWHDMSSTAGITLSNAAGVLSVTGLIGHAVTEDPAWNLRAGKTVGDVLAPSGVWDIELVTVDGYVIPFIAGDVYVDPDVTRTA